MSLCHKFNNLDKVYWLIERHKTPKLKKKVIYYRNWTHKKKIFQQRKLQAQIISKANSTQALPEIEKMRTLYNSFYEANITQISKPKPLEEKKTNNQYTSSIYTWKSSIKY